MRSSKFAIPGIVLVFTAFLLASCSGDGKSGFNANGSVSLSSLILPDNVSVVDPKTISSPKPSSKSIGSLLFGANSSNLDPTSDYRTDKTSVYVNERSLDSFRSVSEILCMVRQSRYDVMLNQGPYIAQIDKNLCSSARSDASSAGQASTNQSSGATMPMYENWTVNSIRASSQSPHIVQAWVHSQDNYSGKISLVFAKIVITEGADTTNPYGIFKMNFKFYDPADLTTILARGFLNAERDANGEVLLYFATEDKDSFEIQKATLNKDIVNNSGSGSVYSARTKPGDFSITRFNIAYDAGNFLRSDSTDSICLDRNNIVESSWRYGLYTTDTNPSVPLGTRVTRNSNFQVRKGSVYGSIGYWGAWFPPVNGTPMTVSDGDLVYKHDYSNNTDTSYTVFQRGGKLKKYTRKDVTLNDIKNIPLVLFASGTTYMVVWDGTTSKFLVVATQSQSDGSWSSITSFPLDLSNLSWVDIGFWSQALGGSVIVKLHDPANSPPNTCTGTNPFDCSLAAVPTTRVMYYKEDIAFPGDTVPPQLACFERCPDAANLATAAPFRTDIMSYQTVTPTLSSYASYSFDSTNMLLTDATGSAIVTSATNTAYSNGITSGLLFDPANLNQLGCPWNPGNTCAGQAWTVLPEFYVWETGPNTWNQFVTVRDSGGTPVRFDPPLQVKYVHSQPTTSAPDYKYNNVTFFLQYAGFGDLQGIPGKCVDLDDPTAIVNCSDSGTNKAIRWVPEFSIPSENGAGDLTEVTDLGQPTIKYFVKALEKEQRLGPGGNCTGLTTSPFQLPSMSSWIDPVIGREPVVTAPPAVVGGVVQ